MLNSWLMQSILIPAIVTAKIVPVCPSQSLTLAAGCPGKVYLRLNKGVRSREGWFGKLPYRLSHLLLNLSAVKAWDAYFSHPFSVNSCSSKVCLFVCLMYSSLLLSFGVTDNFTASLHFPTPICTVTVSYTVQWTDEISGTVSYRVFDAHSRSVRARKCLSFEAK